MRGEKSTRHSARQEFFHKGFFSKIRRLHERDAENSQQRDAPRAGEKHLVDFCKFNLHTISGGKKSVMMRLVF
jgi:hypothetical protein